VINFRYHVVSLTAVFLALAIGLVMGTAALNGPVSDSLRDQVAALNKDNSNKRDQNNQLLEQINRNQDFAKEIGPVLLGGKLNDRRIVVFALPGSDDYADGIIDMLKVAGATVTAKVTVRDKFFDPGSAYELLSLAQQSNRPTVPLEGLPLNSDGVETATAQLALALYQRPGTLQASASDVTTVLTAYSKDNFLTLSDKPVGGAEAAVIISGAPPSDKDAAKKNASAVMLANQLSITGKPVVVAGIGVGDGNLISAVRGDPTLVKKISTVDNASTVEGQVATGLAAIERIVQNRPGQYGLAAGASSMVPATTS
jgi:hypothetical protein